ncbi:flagellar filament capping protein FliD [Yersinia sp. Marseille-Q3913]|uniref:flagellar filament capping protein FliD n=1 Tax=Yersinia sp. Marseille-Q3913 TaxID=2830769 RepID=UPI001BAEA581|nr:flagellar filament capping protein FliD [Yersinia sp. Marseille-Q3913]MBS0053953.1 flagellar filament capping protein FliD [Yersinia sp. Marseille-Q3913]
MLFDMDLNDLATQATNKQYLYEFNNFKSKESKNITALDFIEKTKAGLTEFNGVLASIRDNGSGVVKSKATITQPAIATVEIKHYAKADSVSLFVEQLASAHEIALEGLSNSKISAEKGDHRLKVGSQQLSIDFSNINTVAELANAINQHADNRDATSKDNLVSATVRRINGEELLVLKSNNTGLANQIEFTASNLFTGKDITQAKDAKVKLGGENSTVELASSSNTFDGLINNAAITLTQAHKTGDAPLTINVVQDTGATEAQVKKFADAYNAIKEVVKYNKDNPNPYTSGLSAKINRLAIEPIDGKRLSDFGFTFDKKGQLSVDNKKLQAAIEKDPGVLNEFFNGKDGLISKFDALLKPHLAGDKWSLEIEKNKLDDEKEKLSTLAEKLDAKYESALKVNLDKLKEMERVMEQMEGMLNMFDFEEKKNS